MKYGYLQTSKSKIISTSQVSERKKQGFNFFFPIEVVDEHFLAYHCFYF